MKPCQRLKANFNMNTTEEIYFWKSEWERFIPPTEPLLATVSLPFLAFRLGVFLYFLTGTIWSLTCTLTPSIYLIYLTNWSFTLQLIVSTLWFTRLVWVWWKRRGRGRIENELILSPPHPPDQPQVLPWTERIIWIGVNVNAVVPYVVTLGYWMLLFTTFDGHRSCEVVTDFFVHTFNALVALLDLWVMAVPIRMSHMIFPMITGAIYVFFTGMYEVGDGYYGKNVTSGEDLTFIYPLLNWRSHPWVALISGGIGLLVAAGLHLLMGWGMTWLRVWVAGRNGWPGEERKKKRRSNLPQLRSQDILDSEANLKSSSAEGGWDNPTPVGEEEGGSQIDLPPSESDKLGGGGGGGGKQVSPGGYYNTFANI